MRLAVSTLCDVASARDGLISVLGAGITILSRPSFPAPMLCSLALLIEVGDTDGMGPHNLNIVMTPSSVDDTEPVFEMGADFSQERPAGMSSVGSSSMPVVVDLHEIGIPVAGNYQIEIRLNGVQTGLIPFVAIEVPESDQN